MRENIYIYIYIEKQVDGYVSQLVALYLFYNFF